MANRRMFSLDVVDTDKFLELPTASQNLYFHLGIRADDDGFVSSPKKIASMVNCSNDDLNLLVAKNYLIPFEDGVVVITEWKVNNYIQKDRYNPTRYKKELKLLSIKDNVYTLDTNCIQDVSTLDTQVRLGKDRIDNSISKDILVPKDLVPIVDKWNSLNLSKIISIKGNRLKLLNTRIKEYGIDKILETIENINNSNFLKGQNKHNWIVTFDWFIKPSNFLKVLEGNYEDKENNQISKDMSVNNKTGIVNF